MTPGFNPAWSACSSTEPCVVIDTYCGGFTSVGASHRELARLFYRKGGEVKKCSGKTMAAPVAACVAGKCQPGPRFP
jgi:hypothetical protein